MGRLQLRQCLCLEMSPLANSGTANCGISCSTYESPEYSTTFKKVEEGSTRMPTFRSPTGPLALTFDSYINIKR